MIRNLNKNFIEEISSIAKYNMKYIDTIEIKIHNPKKISSSSLFKSHCYDACITFEKDNSYFYKRFKNNCLDSLLKDIKYTINSKVKL
jgi:hypothetical protein